MSESSPIRTISNDYSHYTPLSSESKEVRLLRILPAALPEAPLVIALIRTKLATCPPYTALSYCWGSLDETESITVLFQESVEVNLTGDDNIIEELNPDVVKDFKVTTNLHAALNSFRSKEYYRLYLGRHVVHWVQEGASQSAMPKCLSCSASITLLLR